MKITPINLAKRVEKWQRTLVELGIAHYRIEQVTITDIMPNADHGDADASVMTSEKYDSYIIWFKDEFLERTTSRRLDETIVHELLHVWMRDLDESLSSVEDYMSSGAHAEWTERVDHAREGMIEGMARLIVRLHNGDKPRFSP